jgi:hypothetical protein
MPISDNDVMEFADVATIRNRRGFITRLTRVVERQVELALKRQRQVDTNPERMASFRAEKPWAPGQTELQRGRAALLREFRQQHNLPVPSFAQLAGKSRQQVYKDLEMRRLLALSIGARGKRIPDWQLDQTKKALTQAVLEKAPDVDEWTLYHALSEPSHSLAGKVPVQVVTPSNSHRVLRAILGQLGIQD